METAQTARLVFLSLRIIREGDPCAANLREVSAHLEDEGEDGEAEAGEHERPDGGDLESLEQNGLARAAVQAAVQVQLRVVSGGGVHLSRLVHLVLVLRGRHLQRSGERQIGDGSTRPILPHLI